jgi:hypothetical protein
LCAGVLVYYLLSAMLNFQEKVKLLCEFYGLPPPPETPHARAILTIANAMQLTVPGEASRHA